MAFLFKHLNISGTFVDGQPERVESLTIPYKALRECLLNALAHRLYDSSSGFVSIAVYDDRVEIENLGTLPADFTLDDMMKPHISHAQNPLIAQIMYFGKYIETWGRGIELMNDECVLAGVPKPEFDVSGGCFRATFQRSDYATDATEMGQQDPGRIQVGPKQNIQLENSVALQVSWFCASWPSFAYFSFQPSIRLALCCSRSTTRIRPFPASAYIFRTSCAIFTSTSRLAMFMSSE